MLQGSVTFSAAAVATAASAAFPPLRSTCKPTSEARGWVLATQPWQQSTAERFPENGRSIPQCRVRVGECARVTILYQVIMERARVPTPYQVIIDHARVLKRDKDVNEQVEACSG